MIKNKPLSARTLSVTAFLVVALAALPAHGVVHVDSAATGTGDGSDWENADPPSRAIEAVVPRRSVEPP